MHCKQEPFAVIKVTLIYPSHRTAKLAIYYLNRTMAEYVWLVTGASSGFGKAISLEGLRRGHRVIATARNSSGLTDLRAAGASIMDLDVTADDQVLAAKFSEANAIYGKITHVANCAGYALTGAVEEATYVSRSAGRGIASTAQFGAR